MKYKKLGLATLAAFVFLMVINMALFPFVFPDGPPERYQNLRPAQMYEYHSLALLLTTALLAFIYPFGYKGGKPWLEGLRFGALMGLLGSVPMGLHMYAMIDISAAKALLPMVWTVVTWGGAGSAIAMVYGKTAQATP